MIVPSDAICAHCGLTYGRLRTGLTYAEVFLLLWKASEDPTAWVYKRRSTVLGLWHSMKLDMWSQHLELCKWEARVLSESEDYIPF